jgi:hypothetical protein
MGFKSVTGLTELLQLVTTSKDYAVTTAHTSQVIIKHPRSSPSITLFPSRCLVAAFNGGRSPSSGFSNCPSPQLSAPHTKSLQ